MHPLQPMGPLMSSELQNRPKGRIAKDNGLYRGGRVAEFCQAQGETMLRRGGEKVTAWQFLKAGLVVMPPALLAALGGTLLFR